MMLLILRVGNVKSNREHCQPDFSLICLRHVTFGWIEIALAFTNEFNMTSASKLSISSSGPVLLLSSLSIPPLHL